MRPHSAPRRFHGGINEEIFAGASLTVVLLATIALASDLRPPAGENTQATRSYSPFVGQNFPQNVFFGDTHLHSSWSTDAGMAGATLGPEAAYRFSRGEEVVIHLGFPVKLHRPLDFIVLADHAENFGLAEFIRQDNPVVLESEKGREWYNLVKSGNGYNAFIDWLRLTGEGIDGIGSIKMQRLAWDSATSNADHFNEPGGFTAFIGFGWTSQPSGNNLHRVVIFRDDKARAENVVPFSAYDSDDPEALWDWMQGYEDATGGSILAIPDNGNLSNGFMFDDVTPSGGELTADYATKRMRWEPLVKMTQAKGTGETHPLVSPDDAFAGQELLDAGNITGSVAKTTDMLPREYARPALIRGLGYEADLGRNPFKFGMIGATENTREALFDAMSRKEVFGTTGSRMRVRVFGGWDFTQAEVLRADFAEAGYRRGNPMAAIFARRRSRRLTDMKKAPH